MAGMDVKIGRHHGKSVGEALSRSKAQFEKHHGHHASKTEDPAGKAQETAVPAPEPGSTPAKEGVPGVKQGMRSPKPPAPVIPPADPPPAGGRDAGYESSDGYDD